MSVTNTSKTLAELPHLDISLLQLGAAAIVVVVAATVVVFWANGVRTQRRIKNDLQHREKSPGRVTNSGRTTENAEKEAAES